MSLTSVLLVSEDPEFAATVIGRWQCERTVPTFVTCDGTAADGAIAACDLAITGPASIGSLASFLRILEAAGRPAICLVSDTAAASTLRQAYSRVVVIREHEGWAHDVVAIATEVLRRVETSTRARRAEHMLAEAQPNATLGRYVLDMRHSLNNALTSILGNSELLLLEPGALSANHREQITTVHNMAMRIHEILQRFNSLEAEMKHCGPSQHEISPPPRVMVQTSPPLPEMAHE